jgi:hypothetical protein
MGYVAATGHFADGSLHGRRQYGLLLDIEVPAA